ncbi:MAG: AMP-binding protein [Acidimicrobiia bacterium]|nr:AMP-binding protein [Acidimicrobiia bacterium]
MDGSGPGDPSAAIGAGATALSGRPGRGRAATAGGAQPTWAGPAVLAATPLVRHFLDRTHGSGGDVAFRYKDLGIWQDVTWSVYRRCVERFALGLSALGVKRGDRVAIMADVRPEWLYADVAVQSLGALTVGVYPTAPPAELAHVLADSGSRAFIAGDQEAVDHLAEAGYGALEHVVVIDARGVEGYEDVCISSYADVENVGDAAANRDGTGWEQIASQAGPDDAVGVFYTVGSTGPPKGVVLSSRNLVLSWAASVTSARSSMRAERTVSHLPLAYVAERQLIVHDPILHGSIAHLPEDAETARQAIIEVRPTLAIGPPGEWAAAARQVAVGMERSGRLERAVYRLGMRARRRDVNRRWHGANPSPPSRLASWAAYWVVCRPVLDKFGYSRLDRVFAVGAPLPTEVAERWELWGVRLVEAYLLTEAAGIVALQRSPTSPPGAPLDVLAGIEARAAPDGELLLRGPNLFEAYRGPGRAVDEEGWFATGDEAELMADGCLRVRDRKGDVMEIGGHRVSANDVEVVLRSSPFIREAVACGDGRDQVSALVEVDVRATAEWARGRGITFSSYGGLVANASVQQLVGEEIVRLNTVLAERALPPVAAHRPFPHQLDPAAGDEVTATRTIKRHSITRKYMALIDDMYATAAAGPAGRAGGGRG